MSKADIETIDSIVRWLTSLTGAFLLPILALVVLVYLVRSDSAPETIKGLLEPFSSLKLLGQELVINQAARVTSSAEATFQAYRREMKIKYDPTSCTSASRMSPPRTSSRERSSRTCWSASNGTNATRFPSRSIRSR